MPRPLALIIEDDEILTELFLIALEWVGFETKVVRDGQVALDRLTNISPDIITLDLHMPSVPGQKILEQIHLDERLKSAKIIIITADVLAARDLEESGELTLVKPVSVKQLQKIARQLHPTNNMDAPALPN